jgi:hypothetical protein
MRTCFYFISLCAFITLNCKAQSGSFTWAQSATDPHQVQFIGMGTDAAGNVYAVVEHLDSALTLGTFTINQPFYNLYAPSWQVCLVKYDAAGQVIWIKSINGNYISINAISVEPQGDFYICGCFGTTICFDTDTITSSFNNNIYIAKFNSAGNEVWARNSSSMREVRASAISCNSGRVAVAGYFEDDSLVVNGTTMYNVNNVYHRSDAFAACFGGNGNFLWANSGGGSDRDRATAIGLDTAGNSYITGWYNGTDAVYGSITLPHADNNSYHLFFVKFDVSGSVVWARTDDADDGDVYGTGLAVDLSGNVFVCGDLADTIHFDSLSLTHIGMNCSGNYPCPHSFIVKFDTNGQPVWRQLGSGNKNDHCLGISADANGNIYATGNFSSTGISFDTNYTANSNPWYGDDIYVVKLSSGGNVIWLKSGGGSTMENAVCISASGDHAIIGGDFESQCLNLDSLRLYNVWTNCSNFYIARADEVITGMNENETNLTFAAYPNPSCGMICIDAKMQPNSEMIVSDLLGNSVFRSSFTGEKMQVDLSDQPAGIYFIELLAGEKRIVKKIVIE